MKELLDQPRPIEKKPQSAAQALMDMNTDLQSIIIDTPAPVVYRHLLRFEDLPKFITPIKKIELLSLTHFHYTSVVGEKEITSDVKIMMRVPDRRIAWQAVSDQFRIGVVFLDPLLGGRTKVTVKVRSIVEPVLLSGALRRCLLNFKQFIENNSA